MALRQIQSRIILQHMQLSATTSFQQRLLIILRNFSEKIDHPDDRKPGSLDTGSNTRFFSDGVKSVFGTAAQKVKEAVGLEKPQGKEGSQGMEPAGVMEDKDAGGDKSSQYEELIGKHKKTNDELLKGANVSDLYNKENTHATSAANTKTGGDPGLGEEDVSKDK